MSTDFNQSKIFKLIIGFLIFALLLWGIYLVRSTVIILIISALIAYILDPIASYFEYKGLSRTQATLAVFAIFGFLIGVLFYFIIPIIIDQITNIQKMLSDNSSVNSLDQFDRMLKGRFPFLANIPIDIPNELNKILMGFTDSALSIIMDLFSIITTFIIIPFTVFFILKDGLKLKKGFIRLIPNKYFEMTLNIMHKTDQQLGGFLRGQFIDASIIGLLATIALWILGVDYFALIGVFAGLTNLIPYVGPLMGAIMALTVVIIKGGSTTLIILVAVAFALIQLTDNIFVQPLVVAKNVDLHPLSVLLVVIIGGQFFGILGMLLAVPAISIIKVLGIELYNGVKKYRLI
jgi:predicted PurR-regulated permease PerM